MANSVTFPAEYGGDGKTYTDDADPNTGLDGTGYITRFVPALAGAVDMASYAKERAAAAQSFASQSQSARDESQAAASDAQEYLYQVEQIAGDKVTITDLRPGALTVERDYVSVDNSGALAKRNLTDDVREQLTNGSESASLSRYDVSSIIATDTLDLSQSNVFRVDATATARTISFTGTPATDRAMTVLVDITGSNLVTLPSGVDTTDDKALELGANRTLLVFTWTGNRWIAGVGESA